MVGPSRLVMWFKVDGRRENSNIHKMACHKSFNGGDNG